MTSDHKLSTPNVEFIPLIPFSSVKISRHLYKTEGFTDQFTISV